jgi:plasmid maintenance system killer protein
MKIFFTKKKKKKKKKVCDMKTNKQWSINMMYQFGLQIDNYTHTHIYIYI